MSKITILGLSGAGSKVATQINKNFTDFNFKIIDTNNQTKTNLDKKSILFLGNGRGSGMNPNLALQLAQKKEKELLEFISNPELLFLIAGTGGTGNGLIDYLASHTASQNILPIVYIIKPFLFENDRLKHFDILINKLKQNNYSYMVIDNQKIAEKYKDLPVDEVYQKANIVLSQSLKTIENLKNSGDVDLNDIKTVLNSKGYFLSNTVQKDSWQDCIDSIVACHLVDFELESFEGLILRVSGKNLPTQKDTESFINFLNQKKQGNGKAKFVFQKTDQEKIQLDLILTGINNNNL